MTMEQLQKLPGNRAEFQQFIQMLEACENFIDERTGKEYGSVDTWDDSRCFAHDGLTGISQMAADVTVGDKPIMTQPEWGVAMGQVERFVSLSCKLACSYVLLAHLDKEVNALTGALTLTPDTLGKKLAPKLLKPFDDIVQTERRGTSFTWTTIDPGADTKSRRLGWGEFTPDFGHIFRGVGG